MLDETVMIIAYTVKKKKRKNIQYCQYIADIGPGKICE